VIGNGTSRGLMGAEGQVVDQIWEKVDDPAALTPTPAANASPTRDVLQEPPPTETPTPGAAETTPLPLESAPGTPAP
jgi:hypothetical protein